MSAEMDVSRAAAEEPSDEELSREVSSYLATVDLSSTTLKQICAAMDVKFYDVSTTKKDIIKAALHAFVETQIKEEKVEEEEVEEQYADEEEAAAIVLADDEEEDEEDENAKVGGKKKRTGGGGFAKPMQLAPELAAIVGGDQMPRTQVIKKLWEYIRANNLQNPKDKREILNDEVLQKAFKVV